MALIEGQAQLRDLVLGPATSYRFVTHFNPMVRSVRADQGGARTWAHGGWSGAEWTEQVTIAMRLAVMGKGGAAWMSLHQALLAAFAPSHVDLPLTFVIGGVEYVMFGRPRMVEPDARHVDGHGYTQAAFVANDPTMYSSATHQAALGLPSASGGLTLPATVPLSIAATVTTGRTTISNAGTASTGLLLRVDGPVVEPRITLNTGVDVLTLRLMLTLEAGQWLDVDTAARTVYLNGTASRRGAASGGWPILPAGSSELAFDAGTYDAAAQLTATWRDAWY